MPKFQWIDSLVLDCVEEMDGFAIPPHLTSLKVLRTRIMLEAPVQWNLVSLDLTGVELKLTKVNPEVKISLP